MERVKQNSNMSRLLHCVPCNSKMEKAAEKFGEYYTSIAGMARRKYMCDCCGNTVEENADCFAACLLPSKEHFNEVTHEPFVWAEDYIKLPTNKNNNSWLN